jgi:hypothetical protein
MTITPEEIRDLVELSFKKHSDNLRNQCSSLLSKIEKNMKKQIKTGKKDPYEIKINFKKGCLDIIDTVRVFREYISPLETKWWISITVDNVIYAEADIELTSIFKSPDYSCLLVVSENPIKISSSPQYISVLKQSDCTGCSSDNCEHKLCSICDINHVRCVVYPCGHADYCWSCAYKISKCSICKANIYDRRNVYV